MNGYKAFYRGKELELHAETSYRAQEKAGRLLGVHPSRRYLIAVVLCEKDGEQVTHLPLF